MQPILIKELYIKSYSYTPYDVKLFKCGDSENSFSFESYMAFSIKCLLFWETSLIVFEYGML